MTLRRGALFRRLNLWFYRHGVRQVLLRRILCHQVALALAALLSGLALWPVTTWIFWFGAGASVSCWSFFSLTKLVPHFMVRQYTSSVGIALFLRSQIRLAFVVGAGALCAIWFQAPIGALLTGFSTILACITWNVLLCRGSKAAGR